MNPADNEHDPQTAVTTIHATPTVVAHCDECNAPVDEEQRYCVVCGAHRRHVEDPASRYLSEVSARSRMGRTTTVARSVSRPAPRGRGLGLAVALALVPAAAAVGVVAERSNTNNDAKLIQALAKEQAAASAASSGTSSTAAASTGGAATRAHRGASKGHKASRAAKHRSHRAHVKRSLSSQIPGGTAISANPPTQAQKNTGAKVTEKVQKSTGKSYVNGQQSLPGTVVVP